MHNDQPKRRLNTIEAAAYLGVSPGTLEVWRSQKRGPRYRRHGRRVVYEIADLDEYSTSRIIETTDTAPILRGRRTSKRSSTENGKDLDGRAHD